MWRNSRSFGDKREYTVKLLRILLGYIPSILTGFFPANLVTGSFIVETADKLGDTAPVFLERLKTSIRETYATFTSVHKIQCIERQLANSDQSRNPGLPSNTAPQPLTRLTPGSDLEKIVLDSKARLAARVPDWAPILNNLILANQNTFLTKISNVEVFSGRFRFKDLADDRLEIVRNVAKLLATVNERAPLYRLRVLVYSPLVPDYVTGSFQFDEITSWSQEDLVTLLFNRGRSYLEAVMDTGHGSDPSQSHMGDVSDNSRADTVESLYQNCSIVFYPKESRALAGVKPLPIGDLINVCYATENFKFKILDAEQPMFGHVYNCVLEALSYIATHSIDMVDYLFRSINQHIKKISFAEAGQVMLETSNIDRSQTPYISIDKNLNVLEFNRGSTSPGTKWLFGYDGHAYLAEIHREDVPDVPKRVRKAKDTGYFPIAYDFETRCIVHDTNISSANPTSVIIPTLGSLAYRHPVSEEIVTKSFLLDPEEFKADIIADIHNTALDLALGKHGKVLINNVSRSRNPKSVKKQFGDYMKRNNLTLAKMRSTDTVRKVALYREFKRKMLAKKTSKRTVNISKHIDNVMDMYNKIAFVETYTRSRKLPQFRLLEELILMVDLELEIDAEFIHLYAHNAQRFDAFFMLNALVHMWRDGLVYDLKTIMKPGAILSMEFSSPTGKRFRCHCTYAHLPDSLKGLCKSFQLPDEYHKIDSVTRPDGTVMSSMDLCLQKPELDPCDYVIDLRETGLLDDYVKYCERDCVALLVILEKTYRLYGTIFGDLPGSEGYIECTNIFKKSLSASSVSAALFRYRLALESPDLSELDNDLRAHTSLAHWRIYKSAVYGGISLSNQKGYHTESLSVYDVKSQYPNALSKGVFVYGTYSYLRGQGDDRSYYKDAKGTYRTDEGDQRLREQPSLLEGRKQYFGPGTYCVNGAFDRTGKSNFYFNSLPIRRKGENLDWFARDFDVPVWMSYIDLNRLLEKKELAYFTIFSKSLVMTEECTIVYGKELYAPYLRVLMDGKDTAEREGNMGLRLLYKFLANSFSGKIQQGIDHKAVDPLEQTSDRGALVVAEKTVGNMKSPVRHAADFLAYVRNELFDFMDALGRNNVVLSETDCVVTATAHAYKLAPYIGPRLGMLVCEVDTTERAYVIAPKTYYMVGTFGGKAIVKYACKGLSRKNIIEQLFIDRTFGESITVAVPTLRRDTNQLLVIDARHSLRTLKNKKNEMWPIFQSPADVTLYEYLGRK